MYFEMTHYKEYDRSWFRCRRVGEVKLLLSPECILLFFLNACLSKSEHYVRGVLFEQPFVRKLLVQSLLETLNFPPVYTQISVGNLFPADFAKD